MKSRLFGGKRFLILNRHNVRDPDMRTRFEVHELVGQKYEFLTQWSISGFNATEGVCLKAFLENYEEVNRATDQ